MVRFYKQYFARNRMDALKPWLICFFTSLLLYSVAQHPNDPEKAWADSIVAFIYENQSMNASLQASLADSAFHIYRRRGDVCQQINARVLHAIQLDRMGQADSALTQLLWAHSNFPPGCDSLILMSVFTNLTSVFISLGELERVDSVSRFALSLWNDRWTPKDRRFAILTNKSIARLESGDIEEGDKLLRQIYREALSDQNGKYIQSALSNLGTLKGMLGDLDSAYYFLQLEAQSASQNRDKYNYMNLLINLANVDNNRGRKKQAIIKLDTVYQMAKSLENKEVLAKVQRARADLFASMKTYDLAHHYLRDYIKIQEEYLDVERVKAVTEMMEKYESEKKALQIQQLELDATLKNERVKNTRNRLLYIGIGIMLVAIGLTTRLRYINKSRVAIQKEKDISEGLLLNILPASVAEELKHNGYAKAMHYDLATILFSDFKEFTVISESLSADELVEEINTCFKAFDEIMTRRGIEKIKTIGDAYMAAGGLPDTNAAAPIDIVLAGLEMQRFIMARKKEREEQKLPAFDMRIGIHSGPVVAGIVGVKKFQYDIWGDTVNIANRLETNGEIGRVNISERTYHLVKDHPGLKFTPRGMIQVKGKGDMVMYFVDAPDLRPA